MGAVASGTDYKVLDTTATASRLIGDAMLDHRRIVNQSTGVAGAGAERNVAIRQELN
jgi:hypothetical protein